jgi:hypothetical protein
MRHSLIRHSKHVTWLQIGFTAMVVVVLGYVIISARAAGVVGDLNNDGVVNVFDLSILLSNWGTTNAADDLNHDGTVNIFDLSMLPWGGPAVTGVELYRHHGEQCWRRDSGQ